MKGETRNEKIQRERERRKVCRGVCVKRGCLSREVYRLLRKLLRFPELKFACFRGASKQDTRITRSEDQVVVSGSRTSSERNERKVNSSVKVVARDVLFNTLSSSRTVHFSRAMYHNVLKFKHSCARSCVE